MELFKQATEEDLDTFLRFGTELNARWYAKRSRVQLGLDHALQMALQESLRRHEEARNGQ